ncbi:MAG TPA: hypothetical protein VMD79_14640 [Solirubrobacteraceae bacterium]|nr:hypothetical protein [Solirubrobacteraceae bacterium]
MRAFARVLALGATLAACAGVPAHALAEQTVALHASFSPDRLGASTTIGFSFHIVNSEGGLPSPLTSVSLGLPAGINYLSTTLGLAICQPQALLARGLAGCSPNARLGHGSAYVEVPFGQGSGREIPNIQALMGPPHEGNIVVLFYANGLEPVYAQIVFEGELIAGTQTLGGRLEAMVPLVPSVPGGPPVSIVSLNATIGPAGLTYYERVHGHIVSFHPQGVSVPAHCPRGGFAFSALFTFEDGTSTSARSSVPCPRGR